MNNYIFVVKLSSNKYWLIRDCKELVKFINSDIVFVDTIACIYRGFRPYYERRGFKYFYEEELWNSL